MEDNAKNAAPAAPPTAPTGWASGGFGAGLVLVVLPTSALVLGSHWFASNPIVGLPVVAVLGIVILFGTLALVSTLFARLGLDNQAEALALPSGSIRAFIALALIVLFALIAVMLFESLGDTIEIKGLTEEQKVALVKEPTNHITALIPTTCPAAPADAASAASCAPGSMTYTAHVQRLLDPDAGALSKQLLTLVGTLMTSAVSFYFASRATEATAKNVMAAMAAPDKTTDTDTSKAGADAPGSDAADDAAKAASKAKADEATPPDAGTDDHVDACHVPVVNPTPDEALPPARGGVTS
jgi:hypothetical protein